MKLINVPKQCVLVFGELIMFIANLLDAWEKYIEEPSISETILGKVTEPWGKNPCAILRRQSEQPHRRKRAAQTRDRERRKRALKPSKGD